MSSIPSVFSQANNHKSLPPVILPIVIEGNEVLRQKASLITDFSSELMTLKNNMVATMYHANGIGLAAPQIGRSIKMCVVDVSPCLEENEQCKLDNKIVHIADISPLTIINPVITKSSTKTAVMEEGCLSVPNKHGKVKRAEDITVTFYSINGKHHKLQASGILARCLQHEIDHLHGILYIDKLEK